MAWARVLACHPELKNRRGQFASFVHPEKLDFDNLVAREFNDPEFPTLFEGPGEERRHRDGFGLTDLRMAPCSGLDLIRQVRESEQAALPIIIISGDADVRDAIAAMHLSVVDFLLKPIDTSKLLALVKHELGVVL